MPDLLNEQASGERPFRRIRAGLRWRWTQVALLLVVLVIVGWLAYLNREVIDITRWWERLNVGWALVAVTCSVLTLVGNAANLIGASPVRLRWGQAIAVQATGTVARLVSPAAVGGAAVNVQYLRKSGTTGVAAVGAVTLAQTVQMLVTLVLLVPIGIAAGADLVRLRGRGIALLCIFAAAVLAVGIGLLVVRRSAKRGEQLRRLVADLTKSVKAMKAEPQHALVSAGGSVLISLGLAGSLWASVHAFDGSVGFLVATSVLLIGSTAGNAVPVPGGLGSVDAALVASLVAVGVGLPYAVPAVVLHRLVTLWLQVPVGLAVLPWLRRRELL